MPDWDGTVTGLFDELYREAHPIAWRAYPAHGVVNNLDWRKWPEARPGFAHSEMPEIPADAV